MEASELGFVLTKAGIADKRLHQFLLKRYDEDYNGVLDVREFVYVVYIIYRASTDIVLQ